MTMTFLHNYRPQTQRLPVLNVPSKKEMVSWFDTVIDVDVLEVTTLATFPKNCNCEGDE